MNRSSRICKGLTENHSRIQNISRNFVKRKEDEACCRHAVTDDARYKHTSVLLYETKNDCTHTLKSKIPNALIYSL